MALYKANLNWSCASAPCSGKSPTLDAGRRRENQRGVQRTPAETERMLTTNDWNARNSRR
jgi:hypothetical protein